LAFGLVSSLGLSSMEKLV